MKKIKKIVLAYSNKLNDYIIAKLLQNKYNSEIIIFNANINQNKNDTNILYKKTTKLGIKKNNIYFLNLKEEFVNNFMFPLFRANAIYKNKNSLKTTILNSLIAKYQIKIAKKNNAEAVANGANYKKNNKIRLEIGYHLLNPNIKIISAWKTFKLLSKKKITKYTKKFNTIIKKQTNISHSYYKSKIHNQNIKINEKNLTKKIEEICKKELYIDIEYKYGDPISINGIFMSPSNILKKLNYLGKKHKIKKKNQTKNKYTKINKKKKYYKNPGEIIILKAHKAIESITLNNEVNILKNKLITEYTSLIHNGYWWSIERFMIQKLIDYSQKNVNGLVKLKLHKGKILIISKKNTNKYIKNIIT